MSKAIDSNGLDAAMVAWDERIHSASKKKTTGGKWRLKTGVDKGLVKKVVAEQQLLNRTGSKEIVLQPVTKNTLCSIFKLDSRRLTDKIAGLEPVGYRRGNPVYDLAEAARYLVSPPDEIVAKIIGEMKGSDLPPRLRKEFWDGMNAKLAYQTKAGELWETQEIYDVFVKVFKTLRSGINLFSDAVSRETGLTKDQRSIITRMGDELLVGMTNDLLEDDELNKKVSVLFSYSESVEDNGEIGGASDGEAE